MLDLTISKQDLHRTLFATQSMVAKKTTLPILVNVLISASDNQLRISASDLEVTAQALTKAQVRSGGSTTVNAKVFGDIVKELPDGDVSLKVTDGERLEIKSGKVNLKMVGVSAEEYPSLPGIGYRPESRKSSRELVEMISKTIYAASSDETRYTLNGVCLEVIEEEGKQKKKNLRMVAVDGYRLAMITRSAGTMEIPSRVIVPRKGLVEVIRVLGSDEEREIGIGLHEGFLVLDRDDLKISMRLIDGEFPSYSNVIPGEKDNNAEKSNVSVSTKALTQALRRVVLMVTDKIKGIRFDFAPETLRVSGASPELGEASEEISIKYDGKPLSIGFNALYVLDIAAALGEEENMKIELHGELGPGKFYSENDESYIAVVMPMRL